VPDLDMLAAADCRHVMAAHLDTRRSMRGGVMSGSLTVHTNRSALDA
jgi:hypothetical protein